MSNPIINTSNQVNIQPLISKRVNTTFKPRIQSIDFLRGIVMIIMVLDHVRDYFHNSAFIYSPTDLTQTTSTLFYTRWITHLCAPVFVFLAGVSANLYGTKRSKRELTHFLWTRGLWLVLVEIIIINFSRTFNPSFNFINLQVIWAIGVSMIVLSAVIHLPGKIILIMGLSIIIFHNLLDNIHFAQNTFISILWALIHEPGQFTLGPTILHIHYPVLPWIGIIFTGYYFGSYYSENYSSEKRRKNLYFSGLGAIALFVLLRAGNYYGDASHWSAQNNFEFSILSFINVTKYAPSLLYILITLGPALIFLSVTEKPIKTWLSFIIIFGRVPLFFYITHVFLIHILAVFGAILIGYSWKTMILNTMVNSSPQLHGYGFDLPVVYAVWGGIIVLLYPLSRWFDKYKRANHLNKWWLRYL